MYQINYLFTLNRSYLCSIYIYVIINIQCLLPTLMRKTYKPLARVEKTSHVFGRKTLNVNDYLDIKVDDDNIENVDDYWSTAASVIGNSTIESMDNESTTEPSDTLFNIQNIRKSIRNDSKNDKETAEEIYKQSIENNSKKAKLTKIVTSSDDESLIKIMDDTIVTEPANGSIVKDSDVGFDLDPRFDDTDNSVHSNNELKENVTNEQHIQLKNNIKGEDMLKTFTQIQQPTKETTNQDDSVNSTERKRIQGHNPSSNPSKKSTKKHEVEIGEAEIKPKNNIVSPVVSSDTFDVATMSLDYLAFVENHKTENPFSIFVINGIVEIKVNKKIHRAKKGTVVVVEKDDVYSIDCVSRSGSVLLLTYAL